MLIYLLFQEFCKARVTRHKKSGLDGHRHKRGRVFNRMDQKSREVVAGETRTTELVLNQMGFDPKI
jgi:hypothetical protein